VVVATSIHSVAPRRVLRNQWRANLTWRSRFNRSVFEIQSFDGESAYDILCAEDATFAFRMISCDAKVATIFIQMSKPSYICRFASAVYVDVKHEVEYSRSSAYGDGGALFAQTYEMAARVYVKRTSGARMFDRYKSVTLLDGPGQQTEHGDRKGLHTFWYDGPTRAFIDTLIDVAKAIHERQGGTRPWDENDRP
jgi:hypothetical protein